VHVELPAEERGEAKALLEESTAPIAMASIQSKWAGPDNQEAAREDEAGGSEISAQLREEEAAAAAAASPWEGELAALLLCLWKEREETRGGRADKW
jgi:hypothetical protein